MVRGSKKPSAVFKAVLECARDQLNVASTAARAFKHTGITGDERAAALAAFFREHLPEHYGVAKGEVIDYRDQRSGQLDIIIYDADMAAPISSQSENVLIPAESLLVVIEVKTVLSKVETENCFNASKKIANLRPFKRAILGPSTKKSKKIKKIQREFSNYLTIVNRVSDMRKEISRSEFGLCSGGITTYEFANLGKPFAIICQVKHQLITAKEWERKKIAMNMGLVDRDIRKKIDKFLQLIEQNRFPLRENKKLVDGKGTSRIVQEITKLK